MSEITDIAAAVEHQRRHEVCTVADLFVELEQSQPDAYSALLELLNQGLRLREQPQGYLGHNATLATGDVKCAMIRARKAGRIDAPGNAVPVNEFTAFAHEAPLHALYVERANYLKTCRAIGLRAPPWPDDEFSRAWEIQAKIAELEIRRDEIQQEKTHGYGQGRQKRQELQTIGAELAAHWEAFNKSNVAQDAALAEIKIPRTANAQQAIQDQKAARHEALVAFINRIQGKLDEKNFNWGLDCMPVTKADFCEVAKREYPILGNFANRTIANDLRGYDVRFRQGVKLCKNNILMKLFPGPKPT